MFKSVANILVYFVNITDAMIYMAESQSNPQLKFKPITQKFRFKALPSPGKKNSKKRKTNKRIMQSPTYIKKSS
jgi:hypothetical protein